MQNRIVIVFLIFSLKIKIQIQIQKLWKSIFAFDNFFMDSKTYFEQNYAWISKFTTIFMKDNNSKMVKILTIEFLT